MLEQYEERMKQCNELKTMTMNMYNVWKKLSNEYEMLELQGDPISFDQTLQQNHKKQTLYKKLDRLKLIEKHSTDLLIKIHISWTCLLLYIHILTCEMGSIQFKVDKTVEIQNKIQKSISQCPIMNDLLQPQS